MEKIKFSVLISIYYKEKPEFFRKAFQSIYHNQTLKPSEIVLVQDGPLTNELNSEVDKFKQELGDVLKIIKLEKNIRLGNALRIGIKECSNDYVARMDTDDISDKFRFEKQMKYLLENPDIDVLGTDMYEFQDEVSNIVSLKKSPTSNFKEYMKLRDPVNHATVIFKKKSVIDSGNYIELLYNEDTYLWARMLAQGYCFQNLSEPLLYVRVSEDSYKRRGGIEFFVVEYRLQKELLRLKITGRKDFFLNLFIKNIFRILPNKLRKFCYVNFLREKNDKV